MKKNRRNSKRKGFHELAEREDIRYLGPLSYRAFKALGWVCIVMSQLVALLNLEARMDPSMTQLLKTPIVILSGISGMALPFFLIANFALILNHSEGYGRQLLRYGGLAAAIAAASILVFNRYVMGSLTILVGGRAEALELIQNLLQSTVETEYFAFNIFVDLFLCTLLMFFLNYRPKRVFVGKKRLIFRCFAILPVGYEVASITLKHLSVYGEMRLPLLVFPFLTVKPVLTFLVFLVLAFFIKTRELRFRAGGKTHEDYLAFLKTRRNSFQFSRFTAITLALAGIVDILASIIYLIADSGLSLSDDYSVQIQHLSALGLGQSVLLFFLAPLMLLFSYTRTHKNTMPDLIIPIAGVSAIGIAYIEGLYQFILMLPDMFGPLELLF